jgi:hypothetical protein
MAVSWSRSASGFMKTMNSTPSWNWAVARSAPSRIIREAPTRPSDTATVRMAARVRLRFRQMLRTVSRR